MQSARPLGMTGSPQGMAVREDVSGFQQLIMAKPADGAALLVGAEHALAKAPLVQALPDHRGHVLPPRGQRRRIVELPGGRRPDPVILLGSTADYPRRFVEALDDAVEIDERGLPPHGRPQAQVVAMMQIGAAIAIAEEPAVDEPVVVGRSRCSTGGAVVMVRGSSVRMAGLKIPWKLRRSVAAIRSESRRRVVGPRRRGRQA